MSKAIDAITKVPEASDTISVVSEVSDIISVLALSVAILALFFNYRTSERQKPLIEMQIKTEKEKALLASKADIQARYYNVSSSKRLKISNVGLSNATNIKLFFDADSRVPLMQSDVDSKFPMMVLEPKQFVDLIDISCRDTLIKYSITVEWDDDFQTGNSKVITLTL